MSPQARSPDAVTTTITSEQAAATTLQDQSATTTNNNTSESEISTTTTAATTTNNNGSALDSQLMMSLMERLQRYPSLLNTNSFLSQPLEDLFLSLPDEDEDEDDEDEDEDGEGDHEVNADYRTRLAKEEAKLERELIRIIQSGKAAEALKPNSGQAVTVRDSHICVGFHEEPRQGYRVWEWHGHVLLYDEVQGYSPEYIYGNYFEKMAAASKDGHFEEKDNPFASSGLRELIGSGGALNGRIVRRNMGSGGNR
ncbi:hypothetical protein EJ110_NYTH00228 [Nymphaea thermarum]|nr:hypothetical protein EJ110_NYTH00228 [Nymphaea thermarum]